MSFNQLFKNAYWQGIDIKGEKEDFSRGEAKEQTVMY